MHSISQEKLYCILSYECLDSFCDYINTNVENSKTSKWKHSDTNTATELRSLFVCIICHITHLIFYRFGNCWYCVSQKVQIYRFLKIFNQLTTSIFYTLRQFCYFVNFNYLIFQNLSLDNA